MYTIFTIYTALIKSHKYTWCHCSGSGPGARWLHGDTPHILQYDILKYDSHTYLYLIILFGHISGGYTFPLGLLILLMGKRAALRPLMPPSAAALTGPCCAPPRSEPCSGRISETRAQLPTLLG